MGRLFGTDGVRGKAGEPPLDPATVQHLGAGLVISASHNPFEDNGIKVFSGAGEKFTEALEDNVESHMLDEDLRLPPAGAPVERIDYRSQYINHLQEILTSAARSKALRVVIDCANGATTTVAPRLFQELGIETQCTACAPDGRNINLNCGSTHPETLARTVVAG